MVPNPHRSTSHPRAPHRAWRGPGLLLCLALGLAAQAAAGATLYESHFLATPANGVSEGRAINERGDVAGGARSLSGGWFDFTVWRDGVPVLLDGVPPYNARGQVYGINNVGQAVGYDLLGQAILWNGTAATALPSLGGVESYAVALNDAGQSVGFSYLANNTSHATLWNGTTATDLGTLGGRFSWATAINAAGVVAGGSDLADNTGTGPHATLWVDGQARDLGSPTQLSSFALGLNDAGHAVGYASEGDTLRAVRWDAAGATFLGAATDRSYANDINNLGQVVGMIDVHAALWNGSVATDLNSFLDKAAVDAGWQLYEATAINDNGWITGLAINPTRGVQAAFLLTPVAPVPEPASALLAVVGLLLFGGMRRWGFRLPLQRQLSPGMRR
jgi:probable HAF family extracellular repeat protein